MNQYNFIRICYKKQVMVTLMLTGVVIFCASFIHRQDPPKSNKKQVVKGCGIQLISVTDGSKSHFFAVSCVNCHSKKAGKADGCFTISGSVYNEARSGIHKNPVVKLYAEPGGKGKLMATIYGDKLGNFYSTRPIDYSNGLYPTLVGTTGSAEPVKHMSRMVFTGDCNKCHGQKVEALGID